MTSASLHRPEGDGGRSLQRLAPPVLVTALLWVGVQILLMLLLAVQEGSWWDRFPRRPLAEVVEPAAGIVLGVNLLFVVLLGLKHQSVARESGWDSPRERRLAAGITLGAALLLMLMQWLWWTM